MQVFIIESTIFSRDYFHCFHALKALPGLKIRKIFIEVVLIFKFIWNSIYSMT